MKSASLAYKEQMKKPIRNRGFINVTIGVINQDAQKSAYIDESINDLSYFSNIHDPFTNSSFGKLYATCEQDFSKTNGSMLFLPRLKKDVIANQGIVTSSIEANSTIIVSFGIEHIDIKGFTIDFGENYPVSLKIENDSGYTHTYTNDSRKFKTEDVFNDSSYITITALSMLNDNLRMRIFSFVCGLGNVFTNDEVKDYSFVEYADELCETLPSQDTTITVLNSDLRYCVDNPDSAINFMEIGQEINTSFGYQLDDGSIEWIESNTCYLKQWQSDDSTAKFTGVDFLENMEDTYYKGKYRQNGITAFDLTVDVMNDAGIEEYYIDPYLKKCTVYNPIPCVKHKEALQMIANAFRCYLKFNAKGVIQMVSSFIPDSVASSNTQIDFSNVENVLSGSSKIHYAISSNNFSSVNNSMKFLPRDSSSYNSGTGFISSECSDENGEFTTTPSITLNFEASFTLFGIGIDFCNTYATEIEISTYNNGMIVENRKYENESVRFGATNEFQDFDKMIIKFNKAVPNTRVSVDRISYGEITDYTITRDYDLKGVPMATKNDKLKTLTIPRYVYSYSTEEAKQLIDQEIEIDESLEYTITFANPCYNLSVSLQTGSFEVVEFSDYYIKISCSTVGQNKITVTGNEYVITEINYIKNHNTTGKTYTWKNDLISTESQAKELEEWIADHYDDRMLYDFDYRGDGRIEVGDSFFLEVKGRENAEIRSYQNTLTFNGAWSAKMKARRKE